MAKRMLQVVVIKRFLNEKSFGEFMESYENAKLSKTVMKEPSDKDLHISKMLRDWKSVSLVAKKTGLKPHQVVSAVVRVSAYNK